jgi:hypothetical protein
MAILYALVARSTAVLAEHSAAATNAGAVARQVLERLPDGGADCHVSYTQDRYVFHAKRTDGITALCMADDAAGRKNSPLRTVPAVFYGVPSTDCFISNSIGEPREVRGEAGRDFAVGGGGA